MQPADFNDASEAASQRRGEEPGDGELVRRAGAGDEASFQVLVERHGARLLALAVSLLGRGASSRTDAEDVVQETFIGALRGLSGFRHEASVKTWLSRILSRQAALWLRKRQAAEGPGSVSLDAAGYRAGENFATDRDSRISSAMGIAAQSPATDSTVGRRLDVRAVLAKLSFEHRQVLELREWHGLSYEEIAEALSIPRGTVESRVHRARQELKARLSAYENEDV